MSSEQTPESAALHREWLHHIQNEIFLNVTKTIRIDKVDWRFLISTLPILTKDLKGLIVFKVRLAITNSLPRTKMTQYHCFDNCVTWHGFVRIVFLKNIISVYTVSNMASFSFKQEFLILINILNLPGLLLIVH